MKRIFVMSGALAALFALGACNQEPAPGASTAADPVVIKKQETNVVLGPTEQRANTAVTGPAWEEVKVEYTNGDDIGFIVREANGTFTYRDNRSCSWGHREIKGGTMQGDDLVFPRGDYPVCDDQPNNNNYWADITLSNFNWKTGAFSKLDFVWGGNAIYRYEAYPAS